VKEQEKRLEKLNSRIKIAEQHQKLLDDYNRDEAHRISTKWEKEIKSVTQDGHHEISALCNQALQKIWGVKANIDKEKFEIA
jgi:uncharacterized protein|tara:strand:+ start:79 stop:324 length:246 start_codon:yes stop_codon:yes gene_type:complete